MSGKQAEIRKGVVRRSAPTATGGSAGEIIHILETVDDAFFALDAQARFTYVNARAERLLLRPREELIGRVIWEAFPEARGSLIDRELRRVTEENVTVEFDGFSAPTGSWYTVRACPTSDGIFVYVRDRPETGSAEERERDDAPASGPLLLAEATADAYQLLAEAASEIAWTARPNGDVDYFNQHWFVYTGFALDQASAGRRWVTALHPDDVDDTRDAWNTSVQAEMPFQREFRLLRTVDGAFRWHLARAVPVRDRGGRVVKWYGTYTDVDDQKRAEEGLRFLARASAALTVSLDYEATLTSIARLAVPALADWCIVDELEDDGTFRRMAVVHRDAAKAEIAWEMERRYPTDPGAAFGPANVLRTGRAELYPVVPDEVLVALTIDAAHLALLRELGFHSYLCVPLIARGRTMGAITFVTSTSGRQYGPTDLALVEDLARRAALAVDNARLYEAEQQARRAAERSAGRTARLQAVTAALSGAVTPAQVAQVIVEQAVAALRADAGLVGLLEPDGATVTLVAVGGFPEDMLETYARIDINTALPFTEAMRRAESIWIESSEAMLSRYPQLAAFRQRSGHAAFAAIPLFVDGHVVGCIGLSFPEPRSFVEEDRAFVLSLARQCAQALERARLYEAERSARADAEAAAEEVKHSQERVVESERLRALGEMASGIAHDFNNMLAIILGRCELLMNQTPGVAESLGIVNHLEIIRQAASDGEETVKRLQAFSGISRRAATGAIDLGAIVRDVVEFTRPRWKDGAQQRGLTIQIETETETVPPLQGSPSELREVLVNMVFNALDAMPHGGTIRLSVRHVAEEVFVRVADTGTGMPESVRRRIFEPFFSTKGTRGAGLGLSMSYGIVARMGGRIEVESVPDEGTTFTIVLPFVEATPQPESRADTNFGPLSILLVDDEEQVLATTQLMLELDGHMVTTANSAAEALQLLRESADPGEESIYDIVLTDLGMPEMNGLQLLGAIRGLGYTLPCLLVTGWGIELAGADVEAAGAQAVLPKPFSLAQLRSALGEIMTDGSES